MQFAGAICILLEPVACKSETVLQRRQWPPADPGQGFGLRAWIWFVLLVYWRRASLEGLDPDQCEMKLLPVGPLLEQHRVVETLEQRAIRLDQDRVRTAQRRSNERCINKCKAASEKDI
jgi:hypothetical protein